jgi:hypothetical protein
MMLPHALVLIPIVLLWRSPFRRKQHSIGGEVIEKVICRKAAQGALCPTERSFSFLTYDVALHLFALAKNV